VTVAIVTGIFEEFCGRSFSFVNDKKILTWFYFRLPVGFSAQ
jgi:hypothetical protein